MIPKPPHPEPPPLSRETEAELRRLCEAATLGPWHHYDDSGSSVHRHDIAARGKTVARVYCTKGDETVDAANAALIVAAVNALATLLDQVASDREMREEAAKGLELIAGFAGKTLLGPQSDRECELAHQTGAAQAFNQAAEIASDTLAKLRTAVPAEERQS